MKNSTSKKYTHALIVYLVIVAIGQITFSNMWSGEISKIDLFQGVIAPACCFAVAALFGWYRNAFTTFFSGIWITGLGTFLYLNFQKLTGYSGSKYYDLLMMDLLLMGKVVIAMLVIATILNTIVIQITLNKIKKNQES